MVASKFFLIIIVGENPCDIQEEQKDKFDFPSDKSRDEHLQKFPKVGTKIPIFATPNTGPLAAFLKDCRDKNTPFVDGVHCFDQIEKHYCTRHLTTSLGFMVS